MRLLRHWRAWLGRSVRAKVLVLALAPLALALPLLLLALSLWTDYAYDQLLRTKVRADLAVARGYFEQVLLEVGSGTRSVAESHALHLRLQTGNVPPRPPAHAPAAVQDWLEHERQRLGLDFLVLRPPHDPHSPAAQSSGSGARLEVWQPDQVALHAPHLLPRLDIALVPTRNAAPTTRTHERRALLMLASAALPPDAALRGWVLHGGLLLNGNLDFIDHINRVVYPPGALPFGSQGTATLFLDDVRISTNVRLFGQQRAIGTRVSQAVRDAVLGQGRTWLDRAFVVNDWYVSAYEPLLDSTGQRIGMLYVGFLEAPLRWVRLGVLAGTAVLLALVMAGTAAWSLRWARTLVQPVERMHATMRQVEQGNPDARVGPLPQHDELGELARHLDRLLDTVAEQTARLRAWGETLDRKVAERTRELQQSNAALRQAQQQLVKSERLATIGQLTAGVAHELNNPVAVIQGNLDLLRDTLGPAAAPVQAELRLIDAQIERIRLIVTRLLQHARPTEFAGYVEPLALPEVVTDCLVLVERLVQQHGITLQRHDHATAPVACNRQELQQVIINLVVNAVQASPPGGVVELDSGDWIEDDRVVGAWLEVRDHGPGLSAEVRTRLFTPFFTTKANGNGLGLWVSQGLLERYGARLEANARADGRPGAVFRVRLYSEPREPASAAASV
ncbi:sensor histidine kinase [Tepidimonas aquatica]|uniref:histidine kinase n=1 Tax=Tepidimonas aquatica TaxID=247482 RepID=A0A554WP97_9BURK|nr:cache domain-containing protein [Tepidimonas aquatica]TSE25392.1 C4-dicarboxylate transport sensor protein DctB [Tepidimonas aquatica]